MTWSSWLTLTATAVLGFAPALLSSQTQTQLDTIAKPPLEAGNRPGLAAPAFTLKTLAGTAASLAYYKGRPVLIKFWSTWCKSCSRELAEIVVVYWVSKESG